MSDKNASVLAWHFLPKDKRLRYGDRQLVEVGKPIRVEGRPIMYRHGLHASIKALDALSYAPGPIACRVVVREHIKHGDDKLVGQQRTVVWMLDATDILREFARRCALEVVHLWDAPQIVRDYLETGNETIRAEAWDAAWTSAEAATRAAGETAWASARAAGETAWASARDAAEAAARAAGETSWGAAKAAARDAAMAAAEEAAREAQNDKLTQLLLGAQT